MSSELFDKVSNDSVKIDENKQVAVRNGSEGCTEIRGEKGYASGRHEICLSIKQISNSWLFSGVNSQSTPVSDTSYKSESAYGWSNDTCIWSGGAYKFNNLKPWIEI